ncbi:hypothetical protein L6164_017051 [Bauhinia variegata]|uniref:Uncharacterized protein n=1 Tax=Bauhinia variegata TaxID=167791 RepID=A0ACB9NAB4_BAUVA|nr:hypothetical protein L6164_017051 [Bauhinia variegata]
MALTWELLVVVNVMALMFCSFSVPTASLTKFNHIVREHELQQLRRNLLANGLALTPPMGYVCMSLQYYHEYDLQSYLVLLFSSFLFKLDLFLRSVQISLLLLSYSLFS